MQRTLVGFEASYRRHLAAEQRRAVLDALAQSFDDESTVGQIVDAAAALGYAGLGDLSLADLADALLTEARASQGAGGSASTDTEASEDEEVDDDERPSTAEVDEDEADDEDEDEDEEEEAPPAKTRGRAKKAPAKGKAAKTKAAPSKAAAKPTAKGKPTKISLDDRMSLKEAAEVLLPLVRGLGQATMQQLEQATEGAGRRKLRFHIGQLVRNGHLERHGMGRGTYYTVA